MQIRRLVVIRDIVFEEGGLPASTPVTRVAACVVIHNPLAGCASEELDLLLGFGRELGEYLVAQAFEILPGPAISYGKGAIVGVDGEIEHAAAILILAWGSPCAGLSAEARLSYRQLPK